MNISLNKLELAQCYGMSVKTLNKIYEKHQQQIGAYEYRRWLPKQIKVWVEILGDFVIKPEELKRPKGKN